MKPIRLSWLLILGMLMFPVLSMAQLQKASFEELEALQQQAPKKTIVFIHTDWCKFCEKMRNTTLEDQRIIERLNNHFYYIDFDAEQKADITFRGHTFAFKPTGQNTGVHELAEQLAMVNDKVSYPSLCVLNEQYQIVYQHTEFLSSADLLKLLALLLES